MLHFNGCSRHIADKAQKMVGRKWKVVRILIYRMQQLCTYCIIAIMK
jgi:hypothetical protein